MKRSTATMLLLVNLLVCLAVFLSTELAHADIFAGNGDWQSASGSAMRGTWTVTLERSGNDVKGNITLTGSMLFSGTQVTGTLDGDQIVLGVLADGRNQVSFSGMLKDEQVSGEWQCPAIGDSGTWSGTLRGDPEP